MRYELTDDEWVVIKLMLPNTPRGVPPVNDRRIPIIRLWLRVNESTSGSKKH